MGRDGEARRYRVGKTLARVIGRGDSLEGDPRSARCRAAEQGGELTPLCMMGKEHCEG
jgi:hypothetical protein